MKTLSSALFVLLSLTFLLLSASRCKTQAPLESVKWLLGTWQNETSQGIIYESWMEVDSKALEGRSFAIRQGDTAVFETIRLTERKDGLVYAPTVSNQNNQKPVEFVLKSISTNQFTFENLAHDFPQMITYRMINQDSLVAVISGTKNGRQREVRFPMSRLR
ncbi:MAG: DUF6265 family protein [Bacteroidota bacterium]